MTKINALVGTHGKHLLVDYLGCDFEALNNLRQIKELMEAAAIAAGAHIIGSEFHPFEPHGVSGVVIVSESHLSIHTWPEEGYAAVDFYTCGESQPTRAHEVLLGGLKAKDCNTLFVERGRIRQPAVMKITSAG